MQARKTLARHACSAVITTVLLVGCTMKQGTAPASAETDQIMAADAYLCERDMPHSSSERAGFLMHCMEARAMARCKKPETHPHGGVTDDELNATVKNMEDKALPEFIRAYGAERGPQMFERMIVAMSEAIGYAYRCEQ